MPENRKVPGSDVRISPGLEVICKNYPSSGQSSMDPVQNSELDSSRQVTIHIDSSDSFAEISQHSTKDPFNPSLVELGL